MPGITANARKFFAACESGPGWAACKEWMKGLLGFMPDGRYEIKSFATDEQGRSVSAYAMKELGWV